MHSFQLLTSDDGGHRLSILVGDQTAGTVSITPNGPSLKVHNLTIRPEHRRQGLGRRLMEEVLSRFGDQRLELSAEPFGAPRTDTQTLIDFYQDLGFIRVAGGENRMYRPATEKTAGSSEQQIRSQLKSQRQRFLSGEDLAFATTLVALLIDHFGGVEWFEWEPDVLGQEVEDDFKVRMPIEVRDKIWGLVTALTTDQFYNDAQVFNHVCNALTGGPTPMVNFEPCTLEEAAWSVLEVTLNDFEGDEVPEFGPEVQNFVGQLLRENDLKPFGSLGFARDMSREGFAFVDDPMMVSQITQDRIERRDEILSLLERSVPELHRQLDALQIEDDQRRPSPRQ